MRRDNGIGENNMGNGNRAFTLIELLAVICIIIAMTAMLVPSLTTLKSAGDADKAAYDIADAVRYARSYAMANSTYVWIGFYEEDASSPSENPAKSGTGRIVLSIVASKNGSMIYNPNSLPISSGNMTASLIQINKLVKIENMHLRTAMPGDPGFPTGSGSGNNNGGSFDTRPTMSGTSPWQIGDTTPANASAAPFQYPVGSPASQVQYLFTKALQISPRGEIRVDDASQPLQAVVEIGLQPTHGPVIDATNRNVTALQVTGISGNVKIYRR